MLSFFSLACEKVNQPISQKHESKDQQASSPTQGTKIYRYLSAISDAWPNKNDLTDLCIRQHGFKLELPNNSIKLAYDVRLPASETWTETQQVEIQKYRTVVVQSPPVNGLVMKPEEKQVPYLVNENIEVNKSISGICIGKEYVLN